MIAEGFVRVASVDLEGFKPRDFPREILELVARLPAAVEQQQAVIARDGAASPALPWVSGRGEPHGLLADQSETAHSPGTIGRVRGSRPSRAQYPNAARTPRNTASLKMS